MSCFNFLGYNYINDIGDATLRPNVYLFIYLNNQLLGDMFQEAAQALIYAGMAGSKLDELQDKVNEYLDRVQALHNAGRSTWQLAELFV